MYQNNLIEKILNDDNFIFLHWRMFVPQNVNL